MEAEISIKMDANLTTYLDSMKYAEIIQRGLLPKRRHFNRLFKNHFTLYKPLNILSGDFYWIGSKDNHTYIAVGDCTGHGVPGALLSVLAKSILEYSIMNKGIVKTNNILKELDKKFIESFSDSKKDFFNNDWVDIALVCIDKNTNKLYFSSANRKMFIYSEKNSNQILKGSPYPIGGWQVEKNRSFNSICYSYCEGDIIYIGSDGFQDQIGGPKEKKYSSKKLHQFFEKNANLSMKMQKHLLNKEFYDWKGECDQIDDVCIVAIEL